MWDQAEIDKHIQAAKFLAKIKDEVFNYIHNHPQKTEYEVQCFVISRYEQYGLKVDNSKEKAIVAFDASSAIPHYWPKSQKSRKLHTNSLVLLDIWARLKGSSSPYADITWVGVRGRVSPQIKKIFNIVVSARDEAIKFIQDSLKKNYIPSGKEIDLTAQEIVEKSGYKKNILHRTGHSIGLTSPHGIYRNVNSSNVYPLVPNLGYTIEPGIYLRGKFGIRSEINFYIGQNKRVYLTSQLQRDIVRI